MGSPTKTLKPKKTFQGDHRFAPQYKPLKSMSITHRQLLVWLFVKAAEQKRQGQRPNTRRSMLARSVPWHTKDVVQDWNLELSYRPRAKSGARTAPTEQTFADGLSNSLKWLGHEDHRLIEVETTGGAQPKVKAVRLTATGLHMAAGQLLHGMNLTEFSKASLWNKRVQRPFFDHNPLHPFTQTPESTNLDESDRQAAEAQLRLEITMFEPDKEIPGAADYQQHLRRRKEGREGVAMKATSQRSLTLPREASCADDSLCGRPTCFRCRARQALLIYFNQPPVTKEQN